MHGEDELHQSLRRGLIYLFRLVYSIWGLFHPIFPEYNLQSP